MATSKATKKPTVADIHALSLNDAVELRSALDSHIAMLQEQQKEGILDQVKDLLGSAGLDASVLKTLIPASGDATEGKRKSYTVKPKYRDPATGKTHSGRGKPSVWMLEHVKNGGDLNDLLIDKPEG